MARAHKHTHVCKLTSAAHVHSSATADALYVGAAGFAVAVSLAPKMPRDSSLDEREISIGEGPTAGGISVASGAAGSAAARGAAASLKKGEGAAPAAAEVLLAAAARLVVAAGWGAVGDAGC